MADKWYFILFQSIHDVLKAEKVLKSHDLNVEVVPVPRTLSSDCGVCIKSAEPVEQLITMVGDMGNIHCFEFDGITYEPAKPRTGTQGFSGSLS